MDMRKAHQNPWQTFTTKVIKVQTTPVTLQTIFKTRQRAVATCMSICIETMGKPLQSLLDTGSQINLLQEAYYEKHLAPLLAHAKGELAEAINLFSWTVANDENLPPMWYIELYITFLGPVVPKVGFLVVKNPNTFIKDKRKTKLPGIVGWNLIGWHMKNFLCHMETPYSTSLTALSILIHYYIPSCVCFITWRWEKQQLMKYMTRGKSTWIPSSPSQLVRLCLKDPKF